MIPRYKSTRNGYKLYTPKTNMEPLEKDKHRFLPLNVGFKRLVFGGVHHKDERIFCLQGGSGNSKKLKKRLPLALSDYPIRLV